MKDTNMEYLQKRYHEYWNRENHDRAILALYCPDETSEHAQIATPQTNEEIWLNFDYVLSANRQAINNTRFLGEAFPSYNPNLGPDILGGIMGCDINFGDITSWAIHKADSCEQLTDIFFDDQSVWFKRIYHLTQMAVNEAKGEYLVGVTDLHAGLDGLVSLIGPENLCYDTVDNPHLVEKYIWQVFDVFKAVYQRLYNCTAQVQGSCATNWMNVLYPEGGYVTSCDFCCLLSPDDFRKFVLPELRAELDFLGASLFHLDGPRALRHLDDLLAIPNLSGIQWVPGEGAKPAKEWIDVLQKIQKAGKLIQMTITPDDFVPIIDALEPEGVMLACACQNVEQANDMLKYATKR